MIRSRWLVAIPTALMLVWGSQPVTAKAVSGEGLVESEVSYTVLSEPGPTVVHVVRAAKSAVLIRAETAQTGADGIVLEKPSEACARRGCVAAVNADFYNGRTNLPLGGVVVDGQMLRVPIASHLQLSLDGSGGWHSLRGGIPAGAVQSLGSSYALVWDSRVVAIDEQTVFTQSRQARTLLGWNSAGEHWFVTVDKGYGSRGFNLQQAAELMLRLGASHAVNLDGGSSSTLVLRSQVINKPSSGERRVPNMWMMMPPPPSSATDDQGLNPITSLLEQLLRGLGLKQQ